MIQVIGAHQATTSELIWVVSTILAIVFCFIGLTSAFIDKYDQVQSRENGPLEQTANDGVRRIVIRMGILVIVLVLGADVATRDVAPTDWRAYSHTGIAILCWFDELGDWISRRRIYRMLKEP